MVMFHIFFVCLPEGILLDHPGTSPASLRGYPRPLWGDPRSPRRHPFSARRRRRNWRRCLRFSPSSGFPHPKMGETSLKHQVLWKNPSWNHLPNWNPMTSILVVICIQLSTDPQVPGKFIVFQTPLSGGFCEQIVIFFATPANLTTKHNNWVFSSGQMRERPVAWHIGHQILLRTLGIAAHVLNLSVLWWVSMGTDRIPEWMPEWQNRTLLNRCQIEYQQCQRKCENRCQDARWHVRIDANRMPEENIRNYDKIIYHGGDHSK